MKPEGNSPKVKFDSDVINPFEQIWADFIDSEGVHSEFSRADYGFIQHEFGPQLRDHVLGGIDGIGDPYLPQRTSKSDARSTLVRIEKNIALEAFGLVTEKDHESPPQSHGKLALDFAPRYDRHHVVLYLKFKLPGGGQKRFQKEGILSSKAETLVAEFFPDATYQPAVRFEGLSLSFVFELTKIPFASLRDTSPEQWRTVLQNLRERWLEAESQISRLYQSEVFEDFLLELGYGKTEPPNVEEFVEPIDVTDRGVWVMRPGAGGRLWERWCGEEVISMGYGDAFSDDLEPLASKDEVKNSVTVYWFSVKWSFRSSVDVTQLTC